MSDWDREYDWHDQDRFGLVDYVIIGVIAAILLAAYVACGS